MRDWHCNQSEFHTFLQNNPQIENICCNDAESFRCILSTEIKLSHVVLIFEPFRDLIDDAFDDLQECSYRGNINSIHIISRSGIINQPEHVLRRLGQMKHVKCLHLGKIKNEALNNIDGLPYVHNCVWRIIIGNQ